MQSILVIDDNLQNVMFIEAVVKALGYNVLCAQKAAIGVELAKTEQPTLILMDYQMPELNGLDATRQLKADSETAHIPIILVTGYEASEGRKLAAEAGCDAFLTKPLLISDLRSTLMGFLNLTS